MSSSDDRRAWGDLRARSHRARRGLVALGIAVALPAALAAAPATAQLPYPGDCIAEDGSEVGDGTTMFTAGPDGSFVEVTCSGGRWRALRR